MLTRVSLSRCGVQIARLKMLLNEDEDDERRVSRFAYFFVWYRNPLFYMSVLMAAYSIFVVAIHTLWGFSLGVSIGLISLCLSIWLAASIFDHYHQPVLRLSSWTKLKGGFMFLAFVTL
jgi:hypothetical protein